MSKIEVSESSFAGEKLGSYASDKAGTEPAGLYDIAADENGIKAFLHALAIIKSGDASKLQLAQPLLARALDSGSLSEQQQCTAYFALADIYYADLDNIDFHKAIDYLKDGIDLSNRLVSNFAEYLELATRKEDLWILLNQLIEICKEGNDWENAFDLCSEAVEYTDHPSAHACMADLRSNNKEDIVSTIQHAANQSFIVCRQLS